MSVATSGNQGTGLGQPFSPTSGAGGGSSAGAAGAVTVLVLAVSSVFLLQGGDNMRIMLAAAVAVILFALNSFSPAGGMATTFVYLAMLGGIKRGMFPYFGYAKLDPMLLAVPVVVGLYYVTRLIQRSIPRDTFISKVINILVIMMFLEIFNPLQGGLTVGFAGALFYIVPVLWYYVGRSIGTREVIQTLIRTVIIVAVLGAFYGLYQTWFGFSPVEKEWLEVTGNDSGLHVTQNATRVFSFFSSFAEYTQILTIAAVLCFVHILQKKRIFVLPFLLFFASVIFSSSRGALAALCFVCVLLWAIQGKMPRVWLPRLVIAGVLGVFALGFSLTQIQSASTGDSTARDLVGHQIKGLYSPLDKKQSTGSDHASLVVGGIAAGFRNPLGQGLGVTTIAAGKFGTLVVGTESDVGNMFVSLGFVGGILYVVLSFYVLWRAAMRWHVSRTLESLATFGFLMAASGFWLVGAHYAETMAIWFLIGSLDNAEKIDLVRKTKELAERRQKAILQRQQMRELRSQGYSGVGLPAHLEENLEPAAAAAAAAPSSPNAGPVAIASISGSQSPTDKPGPWFNPSRPGGL